MRRLTHSAVLVLTVALVGSACTMSSSAPRHVSTTTTTPPATIQTAPSPPAAAEGVPAFAHVFVVLMENLGASGAMSTPSLSALAHRYQWTTNWYAASHPSLPNYLALDSGSTWGVQSDCTSCYQSGADLGAQLSNAGISWGAYFEGMPSPCFLGPQSADGSYAQKHDPFAYFEDIRASQSLCAHLQPLTSLTPLLSGPASAVPKFVWVTPSLCHSGHDCSPATAGDWLIGFVGQVTASEAWRHGGLLVVTWDESDGDNSGFDPATGSTGVAGGGTVLTIVAQPGAPQGRQLAGPFDHYSLLRTIEDAFSLPRLQQAGAAKVPTLDAFFNPSG